MDFENQDFIDTYQELLSLTKQLTNRWDPSTSSEADPGVVLLKLLALVKDKLDYKIDIAQSQAYLGSVTDKESAFELLQMLGYTMKLAKSAEGYVQLRLSDNSEVVTVPKFSQITDSSGNVSYFLADSVSLIKNKPAIECKVIEGSVFNIEKEGLDVFTSLDIDSNYRFYLQKSGLAQNGVFVEVLNSSGEVDYYLENIEPSALAPLDLQYFVLTDSSGENYIQFSDKISNSIYPGVSFRVKATYTKGSSGNIKAGTLSKLVDGQYKVSVVQFYAIQTGQDDESIQQAEQSYYDSMGVFNTLVSAHDYEAALKALQDLSGQRLLSNVVCNLGGLDTQQVASRYADSQYLTTKLNPSLSYILYILALNYSTDYSKSFSLYSDPTNSVIQQQLRLRDKTLGISVQPHMAPRYLAKTQLVGSVFANATTQTQLSEISTNIETRLKSIYNAANLTFGKKLDYQELVSNIKNSDSRIINVALNMPEYQIFEKLEEVDGETLALSEESKISIAAKAAVGGDVPLYKYLNSANSEQDTSDHVPIKISLMNAMFSAYKPLFNLQNVNPIISKINLGTKSGTFYLNKNIALQVNKQLMRTNTEYGFGISYAFFAQLQPLTQSLAITNTSAFSANTIFAGNSAWSPSNLSSATILYPNGAATFQPAVTGYVGTADSSGNVSWAVSATSVTSLSENQAIILQTSYTVSDTFTLLPKSQLGVGSVIQDGTKVNGNVWANSAIPNGVEYQLKAGEILRLSKSNEVITELTSGSWVLVTGLSIGSNGTNSAPINIPNQILTGTQSIATLEPDSAEISSNFNYFLNLLNKPSLAFTGNSVYMLEDGEYFVYANSALTEYVVLGSGTELSLKNKNLDSIELTNVLNIEDFSNINFSVFEKLPADLIATSTETQTFLSGQISSGSLSLTPSWRALTSGQTITISSDGKSSFTAPYRVRLCAILDFGESNYCDIVESNLQITLTSGVLSETIPTTVGSAKLNYLFCSNPPKSKFILAQNSNFLAGNETASFFLAAKTTTIPSSVTPGDGRISALLQKSGETSVISFILPSSCAFALVDLSCTYYGSDNLDGATLATIRSSTNKLAFAGTDSTETDLLEIQKTETAVLKISKSDPESNICTLTITSSQSQLIVVGLFNLKLVINYSDEIQYIKSDAGIQLGIDTPGYFILEDASFIATNVSEKLIQEINNISRSTYGNISTEFDYTYLSTGSYSNPTKPDSFFNEEHPANKTTLPYIDFTQTKNSLKIFSMSGVRND